MGLIHRTAEKQFLRVPNVLRTGQPPHHKLSYRHIDECFARRSQPFVVLLSLRFWPNHEKVRSTTQRLGKT